MEVRRTDVSQVGGVGRCDACSHVGPIRVRVTFQFPRPAPLSSVAGWVCEACLGPEKDQDEVTASVALACAEALQDGTTLGRNRPDVVLLMHAYAAELAGGRGL